MRFSCDHCGRVYAVSDELSGRTFRMKCKACGEAVLVRGKGPDDGLADEPLGASPSISVLHAVEPAATPPPAAAAPRPAPSPLPPAPDVNPFVAQPITVARVAAAVNGSLATAAVEAVAAVPLPPPFQAEPARAGPRAAPGDGEPSAPSARADAIDDLRRSLDEELASDGPAEIEEFEVLGQADPQPIGRLRDPGHRPGAAPRTVIGMAGRRPSDGEGAMALATFTEPAVASVRAPRAPDAGLPAEAMAPSPSPTSGSRRTPLLAGLGLALALGLAIGLFLARRGAEPQGAKVAAVQPAAPAVEAAARPAATVPPAAAPLPLPDAPAGPATAAPDPEPKPAAVAERVAQKKGAKARKQEVAGATASGAEGVVPRGGLLDDDGPRAPVAAGEGASPAAARASDAGPAPAREPVADAPRYVGNGFRAPRLAQADCLSENLRVPSQLAAMVAGPVTVRFAVYPDGRVDQLKVMTPLPDPRIEEAVARAVRACEWLPGADADGSPTPLWVVQPLRFAH